MALDPGHELLEEEIVVAKAAVMRVHEEAGVTGRGDQDEVANFVAIPKVLDEVEASGMQEHLLVIAKPVKVIEHRVAAGGVLPIARRQDHAVRNRTPQNAAGHGKTLALSVFVLTGLGGLTAG